MPTDYEKLETIRQKVSMSSQIVKHRDPEYAWYAGASYEIASRMATIDTLLKCGLIPKEYVPIAKLYRAYLDQQRKAFFASIGCTELSKLGFILGVVKDQIDATK